MKVLVTGGNGFVGQALCACLRSAGVDLNAAVRDERACLPDGITRFVVGEIGPRTDWREALADVDVVVHLAAQVHLMEDGAEGPLAAYLAVNTEGALNLARQAISSGVKRLIYLSSVKVNGEGGGEPYRETDLPLPQGPYALSKHEAEVGLMSLARRSALEIVILRPPLVYGPGVKGNFFAMVNLIRRGIPLPLGAVHNKRSLVALDNLVSFIALCVDRARSPCAANELFLISDGEDVTTTELLRKLAGAYGVKVRLIPVPEGWLRAGAKWLGKRAVADRLLGSLTVDTSKARGLLGWRPVVTMDEQLRKMAYHDAAAS